MGGAVHCQGHSEGQWETRPTICNCIFEGNCGRKGGAISCYFYASPIIEDCVFTQNRAEGEFSGEGGAIVAEQGVCSPTISRCTFTENWSLTNGGALHLGPGYPEITDCTFSGNAAALFGGCLYVNGYRVTVSRCALSGDAESEGGGAYLTVACRGSFSECTFSECSAARGGGVSTSMDAVSQFRNCTFVFNAAEVGGGLYFRGSSSATVENSIVAFGNQGEGIACAGEGAATLSCCDVFGNSGGDWVGCIADQAPPANHNICLNPEFCNPLLSDFTLWDGSPCLPGDHPEGPGICGLIGAWPIGCPPQGVDDGPARVSDGWLGPCVPNPSTGLTEITYEVPGPVPPSGVQLTIFDPTGRLIRQLAPRLVYEGRRSVYWDGTDRSGVPVQGGVYFCRLWVGGEQKTRTLLVVR